MKQQPGTFAGMANQLLRTGEFQERWKKARLVLLPKPEKPPEDPSSYSHCACSIRRARSSERFCRDDSQARSRRRVRCRRTSLDLEEDAQQSMRFSRYSRRRRRRGERLGGPGGYVS